MRRGLILATLAVTHLGCGGESSTDAGGSGGGGGTAIWPADAQQLVATQSGGYMAGGPPGSECMAYDREYTLVVATRKLDWMKCAEGSTATDPYTKAPGSLTISEAELAQLNDAMNALTIASPTSCGPDKSWLDLTVTTPAGSFAYIDSFYGCNAKPGKVFVDNIDGVFDVLFQLAP